MFISVAKLTLFANHQTVIFPSIELVLENPNLFCRRGNHYREISSPAESVSLAEILACPGESGLLRVSGF
jgi:hypothetical protein